MEWITLGIAIVGLGLSIYNAYTQRTKDKRRLKVIIEYISWVEAFHLIIVNTGVRPVTILNIGANVLYYKKEKFRKKWSVMESVPGNVMPEMFGDENGEDEKPRKFPITLKDGEYLRAPLYAALEDIIATENHKIEFYVYDAEGNVFKSNNYRMFDAKYHYYEKIDEFPKYKPDPRPEGKLP